MEGNGEQRPPLAYCPTCRYQFVVDGVPPYSVIHTLDGKHLHPITRQEVQKHEEE